MEVLVVDDHPLIREILPAVLRRAYGEVSVVGVGDLEAAFRQLAHHKAPDLTLLDLELPGHHGLETLRRFRWKFPGVPVAVVSATEDEKSMRAALEHGALAYFPKSLSADDLVAGLRKLSAQDEVTGEWQPPGTPRPIPH
jgi:DNA-binding NarL/FixJ family response regulator